MRILLVAPMPPPHGGMAVSSAAIVKGMGQYTDHAIEVVDISVRWRKPMDMRPLRRLVGGSMHARSIIKEVMSKVGSFRPDVVEIANCGGIGPTLRDYILLRLLRRKRIPAVLTFHFGRIPAIFRKNNLEAKLVRLACSVATCTVVLDAPSETALKTIPGHPWVARRANFIDLQQLVAIGQERAPLETECDVVFVGWMAREKGIFELMRAVAEMPGVRLKFVGPLADETAAELWKLAGDSLDRVEHVGPVTTERVYGIIARARVLALPSYTEAFPYVVLEAMALGKPVVATTIAAIPEILHLNSGQPCGLGVGVGEVDTLKTALARLLGDKNLCRVMGDHGHERVRSHYTESAVMPQVVEHWREVAEKGAGLIK